MSDGHLLARATSRLALVDVQERLCGAMNAAAMEQVARNCAILLQTGRLLDVPVTYTEQYPKGLGPTLASLSPWLDETARVEKICFSCCQNDDFRAQLDSARTQIVLAGAEAHVCVLQTAFDLLGMGKQVFVVEDAVISRNPDNKANALQRLRQAGVVVTNTESVVFEWLGTAEGEAFRQISRLVR